MSGQNPKKVKLPPKISLMDRYIGELSETAQEVMNAPS